MVVAYGFLFLSMANVIGITHSNFIGLPFLVAGMKRGRSSRASSTASLSSIHLPLTILTFLTLPFSLMVNLATTRSVTLFLDAILG